MSVAAHSGRAGILCGKSVSGFTASPKSRRRTHRTNPACSTRSVASRVWNQRLRTVAMLQDRCRDEARMRRNASSRDLERMRQLERLVGRYAIEYYRDGAPTVPDSEYDDRRRELIGLESRYPADADPNSPTQWVGAEVSRQSDEVVHTRPMMSLDNAMTFDELRAWHGRVLRGLSAAQQDSVRRRHR